METSQSSNGIQDACKVTKRPPGRIVLDITSPSGPPDYFRRDQKDGISPPDLSRECTYAEHIVHARGKRTQFTSVSLDLKTIRDFGDADFKLKQELTQSDGHELVVHEALICELRRVVRDGDRADRLRALQALRYATRRREGLVAWRFATAGIPRKDLISWAQAQVQKYFSRI